MSRQATFGGGCFWGIEQAFARLEGVVGTEAGYAGGITPNPTYEQVCSGRTGHAEVVRVLFDPARISYERLLEYFWSFHDPTSLNRQGPDEGEQYRSVIFFHDADQERTARESAARLAASGRYARPIVTQIVPAGPFTRAEEYHQRYLDRRGMGGCGSFRGALR